MNFFVVYIYENTVQQIGGTNRCISVCMRSNEYTHTRDLSILVLSMIQMKPHLNVQRNCQRCMPMLSITLSLL